MNSYNKVTIHFAGLASTKFSRRTKLALAKFRPLKLIHNT